MRGGGKKWGCPAGLTGNRLAGSSVRMTLLVTGGDRQTCLPAKHGHLATHAQGCPWGCGRMSMNIWEKGGRGR